MKTECLIEARREKGEPELSGTVFFCIDPGEAGRISKLAESQGGKRFFLYNSNLWQLPGNGGSCCWLCGPAIGAPMAVMVLEKLIALGAKRFVVFGSCGSITRQLEIGDVLLPTWALSEEGASAHYPIEKSAKSTTALRRSLAELLDNSGLRTYQKPIWTTDAPYRETRRKISQYCEQGFWGVDMEFSALITVAVFRRVELASVMVVSDQLWGEQWQPGFHQPVFKQRLAEVRGLLLDYCKGCDE